MKIGYWLLGALLSGTACSSDEPRAPEPSRPPADDFGVRFAGGETADFGNGGQRTCDLQFATETALDDAQAEQAGLDVQAERAWLATPHVAALRYRPAECAAAGIQCDDATSIELRAEVVDILRVEWQDEPRVPRGELCEPFAYRLAVNVRSDDGNLEGTFYARVPRREADGVVTVTGSAVPDLRNFEGQLPLQLDMARPHYAYLDFELMLASDGAASGQLAPSIHYYDELVPYGPRIAPVARFAPELPDELFTQDYSELVDEGSTLTLSTYPGSSIEPLLDLRVQAYTLEPAADVELTIRVNGEELQTGSVASTADVDLGRHPFGTTVSVEVRNASDAVQARAEVLQDNCYVAGSLCDGPGCTTHVEHTVAFWLCLD